MCKFSYSYLKNSIAEFELSEFGLSKFELSEFKLSEFELSEFELSKIELSEFEMSEFFLLEFEFSEFGLSEFKLSKLELSEFEKSCTPQKVIVTLWDNLKFTLDISGSCIKYNNSCRVRQKNKTKHLFYYFSHFKLIFKTKTRRLDSHLNKTFIL